jgi:hypothetical protein
VPRFTGFSARASHSEVRGRSALPFRERSVSVATADSSQPVCSLYTVLGRKKKRFPAFLPKIFIDVTNVTDICGQNRTRRNRSHFSGDIYVGTIDQRHPTFIIVGSPYSLRWLSRYRLSARVWGIVGIGGAIAPTAPSRALPSPNNFLDLN